MKDNHCINNLLKYINLLQNNSINNNSLNNNYNTRVIELYKKNGSLLEINNTSYFRIMDINNNCCKLLLLSLNNGSYCSMNEYITISTKCICAIRCIKDIILNF